MSWLLLLLLFFINYSKKGLNQMNLLNIILIIGGLALVVYALLLKAHMLDIKSRPAHHDNQKGSHYYESNNK